MYEYRCTILKVIDGDTVDVDIDLGFGVWLRKERIRFMGIDTPESRTSDKEEKVFGLYAKKYVLERMPIGSTQVLKTFKDDKGKFGRILGDFIIDGKSLIETMIEENVGVAYHGQSKDDIQEQHLINREKLTSSGCLETLFETDLQND